MCGRLALFSDPTAVARHFGVTVAPSLAPRWNVAPRQPLCIVRTTADGPGREAIEARTRVRISGLSLGANTAALAESARLNDACLALAATYSADTERYSASLAAQADDLAAFVARVREAAEHSDPTQALLAPR